MQSFESGTVALRSGNLNVLKKRWEQGGTGDQDKPSSVPPPHQPISRHRPRTLNRPPSVTEPPVKSPGPLTDQGGQHTANSVQQASAAPETEDQRGMEKEEMTNEKLEQHVPTSPRASYEKPRVPLNNLKMKFEKGEEPTEKVKYFAFDIPVAVVTVSSTLGSEGKDLVLLGKIIVTIMLSQTSLVQY